MSVIHGRDPKILAILSYESAFGELPDSRRMPFDVFDDLPRLCGLALARDEPLTDEELQLVDDVDVQGEL